MNARIEAGPELTFSSARGVLAAGLARIEEGASEVDCASLSRFDSAALAVLLAWQRAARARGVVLTMLNVPPQLSSLARAYGIDSLLSERH